MTQASNSSGIAAFSQLLKKVEINLDSEQIADLLWLALQIKEAKITPTLEPQIIEPEPPIPDNTVDSLSTKLPQKITPAPPQPSASAYLPAASQESEQKQNRFGSEGIPFKAPTAPALRNPLTLARSLRPLMRKVPSQIKTVLDEEETVTQIAEKKVWTPVLKPAPERWLDIALVVEETRSTVVIWREIITEFQRLIELQGAFRDVRTWSLKADEDGKIELSTQRNLSGNKQQYRSEKELLEPTGRRLVLVVSDCISPLWRQGKIHEFLKRLSHTQPLAIVQLLPERLWMRTALSAGFPVQLSALLPGVPNHQLIVEGLPVWSEVDTHHAASLPVITLEPDSLKQWARVIAGAGSSRTAGILFDLSLVASLTQKTLSNNKQLSPADLVKRFRTTASPIARRLAGLMAVVPISLPVIYLIQETLLKESMQVHVAEVFMSGLLQPIRSDAVLDKPNMIQYEFVEGVRELLIDSVPIPDIEEVLKAVSQYIARKLGLSIKSFVALLSPQDDWDTTTKQEVLPFAQITSQVLRRMGREYAALAVQLEQKYSEPEEVLTNAQLPPIQTFDSEPEEVLTNAQLPPIQTFDFELATITIEPEASLDIDLQVFEFEVATIELKQTGESGRELIIHRSRQQAQSFKEDLGNGVQLEMVAIPEGSFMMGSPENESRRRDDESPQHLVTLKSFFMGKYPITQAQWKAVAALPQVNRELNPDPSRFKGNDRPVEKVSWYDAVEFCIRLSRYTGKSYRLPSEAEWEYACRAGTTSPFHFGETITTDLANYNGNDTYDARSKGIYHKETTPVGSFGVANAFGLYNMHGNVWEWCVDHWHSNYEGAPNDGSVWIDENDIDSQVRVRRGGSWDIPPGFCRSAFRDNIYAGYSSNRNGFRVVCETEFDSSTITIEPETSLDIDLQAFEFEVATIEQKQTSGFGRKLIINRSCQQAQSFKEDLGNGIQLEMVAIPEGSFMMGSSEDEIGHEDFESPQHQVIIKAFLMGKYPITQAQWKAVVTLPQINQELDSNPSFFRDSNLPVENVSWYDAVEFCARLSQYTGKTYRLPSEAEWEYACRAGTTTPFHFGETITPELANYDCNYAYGNGYKGNNRTKTMPVGSFKVANAFGLYDMHGNVWEWCADHWHDNYKGRPLNKNIWLSSNESSRRLLRGGSWNVNPLHCRSAFRYSLSPGNLNYGYFIGFRVVCAAM